MQPKMRADARRNRERVIEAARAVFAAHGVDAQMDDVAAEAGVGVGTVYRHFPTKDALIGELVTQKFQRILDVLIAAQAHGGDPGELLLASLFTCAEQLERDLGVLHVLSGPQNAAVWRIAAPTVDELDRVATAMIEAGTASGTLRGDLVVSDIRLIMGGVSATMADPALAPMWRRHLQLATDALRRPAGG